MPHFPVCRRRRSPPPPPPPPSSISAVVLLLLLHLSPPCLAIRSFPSTAAAAGGEITSFSEAPEYRNGAECRGAADTVHVAMTLDSEYLRGSVAAVHSVLRHATCPEDVFFHFVAAEFDPAASPRLLSRLVRNTFGSLGFKVYIFREDSVLNLISSSVRVALENPLNYARNYLGDILDPDVHRVVYLDSDVVLVDDIRKLWSTTLRKNRVIGAPEYCHANFTTYFTDTFWSDPVLSRAFDPDNNNNNNKGKNGSKIVKKGKKKRACYFNTGVMVMDLRRWREGNYRGKIERWMELQRRVRIYELGSLPPFLLVFAGDIEPIDHRWNQHGLGGDNVKGSCRSLHSGPVSLLHWSGKGKPWVRYDERRPCPLDHLWKPYDLYHHRRGDDRGRQRGDRREQSQPLDFLGGDGGGGNFLGYSNYLI